MFGVSAPTLDCLASLKWITTLQNLCLVWPASRGYDLWSGPRGAPPPWPRGGRQFARSRAVLASNVAQSISPGWCLGINTSHCSRGSSRTRVCTRPVAGSTRFSVQVRPNTNAPA